MHALNLSGTTHRAAPKDHAVDLNERGPKKFAVTKSPQWRSVLSEIVDELGGTSDLGISRAKQVLKFVLHH
jgi:hypothetical protein